MENNTITPIPSAGDILMKRFPYAPSIDWYKPFIECMEEYAILYHASLNKTKEGKSEGEILKRKNAFAHSRGYRDWDDYYNWIARNGELPSVVAQQIESAITEIFTPVYPNKEVKFEDRKS